MTDEEILEKYGWTIVCQSPFEIEHEDGSSASGQGARLVVEALRPDAEMNVEKFFKEFFGVEPQDNHTVIHQSVLRFAEAWANYDPY